MKRDPQLAQQLEAVLPSGVPRPGAEERVLARIRERQRLGVSERAAVGAGRRSRALAGLMSLAAVALAVAVLLVLRGGELGGQERRGAAPAELSPAAPPGALTVPSGTAAAARLVSARRGIRVLGRAGATFELRETDAGVECHLALGEILVHVPEGAANTFTVVTPAARALVTGTVFGVSVAPTGATSVSVWEGEVRVENGAGRTNVGGGEHWPPETPRLEATREELSRLGALERVERRPTGKRPHAAVRSDARLYELARSVEASGDRRRAATLYERAAQQGGPAGEAALFAAARVRSGLSDHGEVRRLVAAYRARHPRGAYARAADVLLLRSLSAERDASAIEREAAHFLASYPDDLRAPQFRSARAIERARRGRCAEASADAVHLDQARARVIAQWCSVRAENTGGISRHPEHPESPRISERDSGTARPTQEPR